MELIYRKAGPEDLDLLVRTRIEVLRAANGLPDGTDMTEVERASRLYYERALADGSHTAILVFDSGKVVGTGGVSYYTVMPTYHNPSGRKAYIMNMYTDPAYRRRGIASRTLSLLIQEAEAMNIHMISLEATAAGRPLYEKAGFVSMQSEMEWPGA